MKKILTIILLTISLSAFAQDSVKITVSVQARDLAYIYKLISTQEVTEDLFDSAKVKFRPPVSPPNQTTPIQIRDIEIRAWISIINSLKRDFVALSGNVTSRVDANLRAAGNSYLNGVLDGINASIQATLNSTTNSGYQKFTRQ